jgi:hypothetical protein
MKKLIITSAAIALIIPAQAATLLYTGSQLNVDAK